MNLVLASILIGNLTITAYRSVPHQTDDSPLYTSTGEHVNVHGIAVSQDLLRKSGGPLNYGDLVYVEGLGFKTVNDCMNKRHHNAIDVWVERKEDEQEFFKKFRNGKRRVWLIIPKMEE